MFFVTKRGSPLSFLLNAESEFAWGTGETFAEVPSEAWRAGGIHLRRDRPHRVQEHPQGHQVLRNACKNGE